MSSEPHRFSLIGAQFVNEYALLGETFYSKALPTPVAKPTLIALNSSLAQEFGLNLTQLRGEEGVQMFAGNWLAEGAAPLAQAYSGHQFGYFNPELGDGRAILLGELLTTDGQIKDIQLKGSGPTPYSRNGDGRAALGPVIREFLISEAMYKLGIKTTRVLAAVATGEPVFRQNVLPGAVLTRVASSHIRVGTFEFFRSRRWLKSLKLLADFVIKRHYPQLQDSATPYLDLLREVQSAQIQLIASWMSIGFIHGVMNTDNTTISGETIDYGPCAFMDAYDPATVFSSIDRHGRYAYGNQPDIGHWNITRFAECIIPLLPQTPASIKAVEEILAGFTEEYNQVWLQKMSSKLGIAHAQAEDQQLVNEFLQLLFSNRADFTNSFRNLLTLFQTPQTPLEAVGFTETPATAQAWFEAWQHRLNTSGQNTEQTARLLHASNPVYIPRNHKVEEVIDAAELEFNFEPLEAMLKVLSNPFAVQAGSEAYALPAPASFGPYKTFCGT